MTPVAPPLPSTTAPTGVQPRAPKVDPKLEAAAQQFEAVFIRQLLQSLEKAGSTGGKSSVSSGSGVYGSMMVGSLADAASSGGGIGLSQLVLEALTRGAGASQPESPEKPSS